MLCKKTKGTIARVYASYNEVSCALEKGHVQKRGQGTQACNVCAFTHWNSWYVYILKNNYYTWNLDSAEAESNGRSDGKNMRFGEKYISVLSILLFERKFLGGTQTFYERTQDNWNIISVFRETLHSLKKLMFTRKTCTFSRKILNSHTNNSKVLQANTKFLGGKQTICIPIAT